MKGLVVVATSGVRAYAGGGIAGIFARLGLPCDVRIASDVAALGGKSFINAQYDFAVCVEYRKADNTGTTGNEMYSWVSASPGDKPIFYLGGQVRGSIPSDFPIKAFSLADATTYYTIESGQYATEAMLRIGSCVRRVGSSERLWGRFANYTYPNTGTSDYGFYRCDLAKLDANREILWQLDHLRMGISAPPADHAVVVRYYNRYFLPQSGYNVDVVHHPHSYSFMQRVTGLGLLLWCMSREGIRPQRRLPVWVEVDHPISTGGYVAYTEAQKQRITRQVWDWARLFCKEKGITIIAGLTTHHTRDATWGHQYAIANHADAAAANEIMRLMEQEGTLGVCWHDHSAELGATGFSYTRHSGGSYGTPNSITHADCNFGSGASATMALRSLPALRVHIEDQENWIRQWGFQSAWGGRHRHINCANNSYGGWQVLSLLNQYWGLRSIRCLPWTHTVSPTQGGAYRETAWGFPYHTQQVGGVDLIPSEDVHITAHRGLYNPGAGGNDRDLNQVLGLGATNGMQAYRRYMAWMVDRVLTLALEGGVPYLHDFSWKAASINDPLGEYASSGNWNGFKELLQAADELIRVLSDWLFWGTPSDRQEIGRQLRSQFGEGSIRL